jgi:hypothetical protein
VIKEAKRQYYSQLLAQSQNKVKMTWNVIKNETGRRSVTEQMPSKLSNNGIAVNLENAADAFNKYFVNTTEDINKATVHDANNTSKPSITSSSVYEQDGDKWIPTVHNSNKKMKTLMVTSMETEQPIISSNRFTPLTNLNENLNDGARLKCNSQWLTSTKSTKNPLINLVLVIKYLR